MDKDFTAKVSKMADAWFDQAARIATKTGEDPMLVMIATLYKKVASLAVILGAEEESG